MNTIPNFTLHFVDDNGHTYWMVNFVAGKINWAWHVDHDVKETDPDTIAEMLFEMQHSCLTGRIAVAD